MSAVSWQRAPHRHGALRLLRLLGVAAAALVAATCADQPGGPARHHARLTIAPVFDQAVDLEAFNLTIDNVRLVVTRPPSDVVLDKTYPLPPDQNQIQIVEVITLRQASEAFRVTIEYRSGSTVLFSGTSDVTLTSAAPTPPTEIPVRYSGPGQNVASLVLTPADTVLSFGATLQYTVRAFDGQGASVPDFYVAWSTSDAGVPIDALGRVTAPSQRRSLTVTARTPNAVTTSTSVTFQPVPASLTLVSGDGQTGSVATPLAQPLVARVLASDALGVQGVTVAFAVTAGGGTLSASSDTSDANGDVSVTWTLGATAGAGHAVQASVPGLAGSPVTFGATAIGNATQLAFTVQPTTAPAGQGVAVIVEARDAAGARAVGFGGDVTIAIGANPSGGTLLGTATVTAVNGVASFTGLSVDLVGVGYTWVASATGLASATSAAFDIAPGAPAQLTYRTEPSAAVVGGLIAPSVEVEVRDGFGNLVTGATNAVTVDLVANPGGATLGGTTTIAATGGVATFPDLTLSAAGTGYTLGATSSGLTGVTSSPFDVTPVVAGTITWINPAGGAWSAPANWSPARAPIAGDSVVITLGGTFTVTLDVSDTVAALTLGAASGTQTLDVSARTLGISAAATVAANGDLTLVDATLNGPGVVTVASGGTLLARRSTVNAALDVQGTVRTEGTAALAGALTTGAGATLVVTRDPSGGVGALTVAAGFTNNGLVDVDNTGTATTTLVVNGVLVNAAGATLRTSVGGGGSREVRAVLDNRGLVDVQQTMLLDQADAAHANSGTIAVAGANLTVTQTGTAPSFTSTGTITVGAGRMLTVSGGTFANAGAGLIQGTGTLVVSATTFSNAATMGPGLSPGLLTVTGDYPQTAGGTLAIELGGTTVGTEYDRLAVSGAATLAGTLDVTLIGGFTPSVGNQFTVLTFGSVSGDFGTVNLPVLGGGLDWQRTFTGSGMLLEVITAAATPAVNTWATATSGLWSDPARWSQGRAPIAGDTVEITAAGTYTVTLDVDATVDSLVIGGASGTQTLDASGSRTLTLTGDAGVGPNGRIGLTSGDLTVAGGNVLRLNGGAIQVGASRTFGVGVGGDVSELTYIAGSIGGPGSLYLNADAQLNLAANLTLDSLLVVVSDGAVNPFGSERLIVGPGSSLKMVPTNGVNINTILENRGTVDAVGPFNFVNDSVVNLAGAVLRSDAGDLAYASAELTVSGGLRNAGTVELVNSNGASSATARLQVTGGALRNEVGGVVLSAAGAGTGGRVLNAVLDNRGAVTVDHPLTLARASAAHLNDGVVRLTGGDLTVTQSGTSPSFTNRDSIIVGAGRTLTVTGGTFNNAATPTVGVIAGVGSVDVSGTSFVNNGVLSPGLSTGILTWTGVLPFGTAGVLDIELGGTAPGTQYDRLDATGFSTTLGGTLNVTFTGGFMPAGGEQFTVLTFGSRGGDFGTVNLPSLPGGLTWQRTFSATSMDLTVSGAFVGAPPGTDAVWTGGSSTSWTDAANWVPGLPGTTDDVWIRADAPNQPVVTGVRTVDSLVVQAGASVTVGGTADTLVVGGSLDAGYTSILGGGAVRLTGSGQTARGQVPSLAVTGTIAAADSLLVAGNLAMTGSGDLNVGAQRVTVGGALSTAGAATLTMQNAAGQVIVAGPAAFGGGSTAARLTAGTLDLRGSFVQTGATSATSFAPSGTHLTHFRNPDFTEMDPMPIAVTVGFANPDASTGSRFHDLIVDQGINATFSSRVAASGSAAKPVYAGISGSTFEVLGDLTLDGAQNGAVFLDTALVGGVFTPNLSSQDYGITTVVFTGTGQIVPVFPHFVGVVVRGDSVVVANGATMLGLVVDGTGMADIGGNVQTGNFETRDQGRLRQTGGSLFVQGNAIFGGGNTANLLTGGTLSLVGNFTQTGSNSTSAFAPSGAHVTELIGASPQTVAFGDPDFSASRFAHVMVAGSGGVTFVADAVASGQLRSPSVAGGIVRTLSGSGTEFLLVLGLDADSLVFDGLLLEVSDGAAIDRFNDVTFVNQDPGSDQFALIRAAGTHTFSRITFQTTPDPGSVYMALTDADGTGATPFTVTMDQPSPADPGAFASTDGIAVLNWPVGALLGGTVRNAVGGLPIAGATVDLKAGPNALETDPTLQSTLTDGTGLYGFAGLGTGNYTLFVSATGFITGNVTGIVLVAGATDTVDVALSPLQQAGETRIVLSWGADPPDLDSYLLVPDTLGGAPFFVYYASPGDSAFYPFARLDNDVTTGFGPETITILQQLQGVYQYRVHDFTNGDNAASTALQASQARVDVYQNNTLVQTFIVPNAPGTLWTVFALDGATLTPINTMSGDPPAPAQLSGTVRNAVGGLQIFGATVDLKQGANAPESDPTLQSIVTDESGQYFFSDLPPADYTLWVSATGFVTANVANVALSPGLASTVDVALSPLQQASQTRIVLAWGADPPDLDSHLSVPDTAGGAPFVVYFGSPGDSAFYPFARLDNDVTSGFGPETITIFEEVAGVSQYHVHDFTNGNDTASTALLASGARVDIYQGNTLVQTFTVPIQPGTLWTVFELSGGVITPINTMSGDPPPGGGAAASPFSSTAQSGKAASPRRSPVRPPTPRAPVSKRS